MFSYGKNYHALFFFPFLPSAFSEYTCILLLMSSVTFRQILLLLLYSSLQIYFIFTFKS